MSVGLDEKTKHWFYQVKYKDNFGKVRVLKKRGFKLKRDALKAEAEAKANINRTIVTFRFLAEEYLKSTDADIKHKERKLHNMEHYFDYIDYDINKITKLMLLNWHQKIKSLDLSTNVKNKCLQYVKSVYKFGHDYYDINNISHILTSIKKNISEQKEMEVWTVDEFNQFISFVDHPIYKAYFYTLFWTGIRRGEGIALLKDDLTEDGYLIINKSIRIVSDGPKSPKTASSVRKIKLDIKTYEMLKTLKQRPGTILFGDDTYLSSTNIQRHFRKAIKESGVKPIRIHDLRHSHATILINSGANIVAVSKRLGHSDINMTLKVYTHLLDKTSDELVSMINNIN